MIACIVEDWNICVNCPDLKSKQLLLMPFSLRSPFFPLSLFPLHHPAKLIPSQNARRGVYSILHITAIIMNQDSH